MNRPTPCHVLKSLLAGSALAGLSAVPASASPPLEEIYENLPEVILNDLVYSDGDPVSAVVRFKRVSHPANARLAIVYAAENSGDVEVVALEPVNDPLLLTTKTQVEIRELEGGGKPEPGDGVLELAPGETFVALLSYDIVEQQKTTPAFAADWGMLDDPNHDSGPVEVRPGLALTEDEENPAEGMRPVGTLFVEGGVGPVQVGSQELLFLPISEQQTQAFLERTGGTIEAVEGFPEGSQFPDIKDLPQPGTAWLRVKMGGDPGKIAQTPLLRTLVGDQVKLSASNQETLALYATAMELWMEGYRIGLNPRLQLHGDLSWPEALVEYEVSEETPSGTITRTVIDRRDSFGRYPTARGEHNPAPISNEVFGVRQSWAYLAMFDYDRNKVPVGVIDSGFATNPDFPSGHPLYFERNLATGASGIGSAQTPQEVGNSFFGDKAWHGNGSVTTICGQGGNNYGVAGIGAQTGIPKLYHMGLGNFALGFGTAIRRAVDDGCSVINISAGYPCVILSVLGNDDICSTAGRTEFVAKLSGVLAGAAAAACGAAPIIDAFVPGLGTTICGTAIATGPTSALGIFASIFIGETRGPVESGVAYATANGVPVVASAGNRLSDAAIGALAEFVNNENTNIDDWQVIPAVIPDVIAVGACYRDDHNVWRGFPANFYCNLHFWGDSVDIWAPIGTYYYAPEPGEADPATISPADHIQRTFGGTSNAAPYITGVICNLMAIDRTLDRRFAAPEEWPNLPARVRDLLVNTAYQAGDPEAPDSADDRVLFEFNEDTETFEEIDIPQELLDEMERRRNYVNAWAAVQQAASNVGAFDYLAAGYEEDLGRDDRFTDVSAPGIYEPVLNVHSGGVLLVEEIGRRDREFWWLRNPNFDSWRYDFTATFPASESATSLLINNRPGVFVSESGGERTVSWQSPRLFPNTYFPLAVSGLGDADLLYKLQVNRTNMGTIGPDSFDFGALTNDSIDDAAAIDEAEWEEVTPSQLLEVDAWQLCVEDLNLHSAEDVDYYEIPFPELLGIPTSCGSLNPWITIQIVPPSGVVVMEVYSRAGGTDTLLARGNGNESIRIDCRDYLGRFPLIVKVRSPGGGFAEYDLKVRWSVPSQDLGNRLDRIREAHAGGRGIPFHEQFFRPGMPWLFTSPGLLPDLLVNPNPAINQALDLNGRFLASRLFLLEVPDGLNAPIQIRGLLPAVQSLRMELVALNEFVFGSVATPDLIDVQVQKNPVANEMVELNLVVDTGNLPGGVYILRLSGHRPGDQISLFLSGNLLPFGGLSVEDLDLLDQGGEPTLIGFPFGYDGTALSATSSFIPSLAPGTTLLAPALAIGYDAQPMQGYQLEIQGEDGIWEPSGSPVVLPNGGVVEAIIPAPTGASGQRLRVLGTEKLLLPAVQSSALRLSYQSLLDIPYTLTGSSTLQSGPWPPFGENPSGIGDGSLMEWFFNLGQMQEDTCFWRISQQ